MPKVTLQIDKKYEASVKEFIKQLEVASKPPKPIDRTCKISDKKIAALKARFSSFSASWKKEMKLLENEIDRLGKIADGDLTIADRNWVDKHLNKLEGVLGLSSDL